MTKRRCLLVLFLGMLWVGTTYLLVRASPVSKDNFMRIKDGMTKGEVESILGVPDNTDYAVKMLHVISDYHFQCFNKGLTKREHSIDEEGGWRTSEDSLGFWVRGETFIRVGFSDNNKVVCKLMFIFPSPTPTERIRYWLGI